MILKTNQLAMICLPPAISLYPSSGMTAIKSYMQKHSIHCDISYYNISVKKCFFKNKMFESHDLDALLPYIYLYNKYICDDSEKSDVTKLFIKNAYADLFFLDDSLFEDLFEEKINELRLFIDSYIDIILNESPILIGFSSKFRQWIPAAYFSHVIKQKSNIPILIGGWTTKDSAQSFVSTHNIFDYSIWGEGEIPTLRLMNSLIGDYPIDAPRLFSNKYDVIHKKYNENNTYVKLDNNKFYDFSDYISQSPVVYPIATIERSRGCNWNKCRFCYLSQGYKYRIKNNAKFVDEIKYYIEHYNLFKFALMDNDFIGKDIDMFTNLLGSLKELKINFPDFEISMAEVITYKLTNHIISLMSQSGIRSCQIGLEAISQTLLRKMRKNQSVAHNIFFIKNAIINNISVIGANVIINTPDEDENDIIESINNLKFFRFFLASPLFSLNVIQLVIGSYSSYLKQIKDNNLEDEYKGDVYYQLLSNEKLQTVNKYSFFDFTLNKPNNILWNQFDQCLKDYSRLKFSYKIIQKQHSIVYKEYSKRRLIKCIEIEDRLTLIILDALNCNVYDTLDELMQTINTQGNQLSLSEVKESLKELFNEGIVFYTDSYENITSIINYK